MAIFIQKQVLHCRTRPHSSHQHFFFLTLLPYPSPSPSLFFLLDQGRFTDWSCLHFVIAPITSLKHSFKERTSVCSRLPPQGRDRATQPLPQGRQSCLYAPLLRRLLPSSLDSLLWSRPLFLTARFLSLFSPASS